MRRREAIAGAASLGLLTVGGAVAVRGMPSLEVPGTGEDETERDRYDPMTVETLDLSWTDGEPVSVPEPGTVTFLEFFATTCEICRGMLPDVTEARAQVADDVRFVSVTPELVGPDGQVTAAEVETWWTENGGGEWPIGVDETAELQVRHEVGGIPTTVVLDADGVERWSHVGESSTEELVDAVRSAREPRS